jgi:hypothetical protein
MSMTMTRRDLAKLGLGLGAAAALGRNAFAQTPPSSASERAERPEPTIRWAA